MKRRKIEGEDERVVGKSKERRLGNSRRRQQEERRQGNLSIKEKQGNSSSLVESNKQNMEFLEKLGLPEKLKGI
jgi:hypothetical protein